MPLEKIVRLHHIVIQMSYGAEHQVGADSTRIPLGAFTGAHAADFQVLVNTETGEIDEPAKVLPARPLTLADVQGLLADPETLVKFDQGLRTLKDETDKIVRDVSDKLAAADRLIGTLTQANASLTAERDQALATAKAHFDMLNNVRAAANG